MGLELNEKLSEVYNVILFGPSGSGKSSLVNMICDKQVAVTSNGTNGCTFKSDHHEITIDNKIFSIHDTVGLDESDEGTVPDHYAIANLYQLMQKLEGGVSLLIFCLRAGRLGNTVRRNWHFFHDIVCRRSVPCLLVVTGLEEEISIFSEIPTSVWWHNNRGSFRDWDINPRGVACITTTKGKAKEGKFAYGGEFAWSRELVMKMIVDSYRSHPLRVDAIEWLSDTYGKTLLSFLCPGGLTFVEPVGTPAFNELIGKCGMDEADAQRLAKILQKNEEFKPRVVEPPAPPAAATKVEQQTTTKPKNFSPLRFPAPSRGRKRKPT